MPRLIPRPQWLIKRAAWLANYRHKYWAHACGWYGIRRGSTCPKCGATYPDLLGEIRRVRRAVKP